jgi:Xaa-Pro aminopeptidase
MRLTTSRIQKRIGIFAALAILCACGAASARFRQPNDEYAARRAKLRAGVDGPIVIYGYTGHEDESEVAIFFQEPSFYYLTGHSEPGAVLVIAPNPATGASDGAALETFYMPVRNLNPHDTSSEVWEGPKIGPSDPDVHEKTGFANVEPIGNLKDDLAKLSATYKTFYTIEPAGKEEGYPHFTESVAALHALAPGAQLKDISPKLFAQRQVKDAAEIALLQKATDLSIDAHFEAMKMMRPGLWEYQIAARMKQVHEMGGCAREAYAPIVGTGFNGSVLHYATLDSQIQDGDLVVIDVGGEYGGYAADITRTFPANGHFTPRQLEIYNLVLGAQNAALAATKPGARILGPKDSLQQVVIDYFNSHPDSHGNVLTKYYPHSVSHHIGLDVHDPGDRTRPLEPGMEISMEPGLYIPEEKIGVRIEDDVLITKDGYTLMTGRLPRTAEEIEKYMAEARATAPSGR